MATHEVMNQTPPLTGIDALASDTALSQAATRFGCPDVADRLSGLGALALSDETRRWAENVDRHSPRLVSHDRYGNRVDEVDFHPDWHRLMSTATEYGLHAAPWFDSRPGAHVARAVGFMVWSQAESGHGCPISMTYASIPALRAQPELLEAFGPKLGARTYAPGNAAPSDKPGLIAGMAMTEKQGGSDVRANTTTATPVDSGYLINGHKWFCSAPQSDLFLVLAQAPGGLTCFVAPRIRPDGTRNGMHIMRLKEKLGNRSNASSEIEFEDAWAQRLGEEGRGVATIVEMVSATRLDCVLGSTSLMRRATTEAIWHARHRRAFGSELVDKPAMRAVLADLALETEAATWLGVRLAAAVDRADDPAEGLLRRIALPASKFLVTKQAMAVTGEALECLGGNGYAEESGMPRLYREAPVNSVWEGSGNVNALDLLRAVKTHPDALGVLEEELRGVTLVLDVKAMELLKDLHAADEWSARRLAERTARLLQAGLLLRHAPSEVAEAFWATRVDGDRGWTMGTLPRGVDAGFIVDRALAPA